MDFCKSASTNVDFSLALFRCYSYQRIIRINIRVLGYACSLSIWLDIFCVSSVFSLNISCTNSALRKKLYTHTNVTFSQPQIYYIYVRKQYVDRQSNVTLYTVILFTFYCSQSYNSPFSFFSCPLCGILSHASTYAPLQRTRSQMTCAQRSPGHVAIYLSVVC